MIAPGSAASATWKLLPIAALYLALAAPSAAARVPMSDEGWFGIPAWHLAFQGRLVNPVVVPVRPYHEGIDRKTYVSPPLHFLEVAAAFRAAGFGLIQARAVSVLWGLVAVLAGASLVRTATGSSSAGLVAGGLAAVDFGLLSGASQARPDLPCFAAGLAGVALYFSLRVSSLPAALAAGNALVATGGLLHPNGLCAFVFLQAATLALDGRRLRGREILLALAPYAVAAMAWGGYALQDVPTFESQLLNVLARAQTIGEENSMVWLDVVGLGSGSLLLKAVRLTPLVLLVVLLAAASWSAVKSPTPGLRLLVLLAAWNLVFFAFFSPTRRYDYLLFATVPLCLVAGAFLADPSPRPRLRSPVWAVLAAVIVVGSLTRTASRIAGDAYSREWRPVVDFVVGSSGTDETVGRAASSSSASAAAGRWWTTTTSGRERAGCRTGRSWDAKTAPIPTRFASSRSPAATRGCSRTPSTRFIGCERARTPPPPRKLAEFDYLGHNCTSPAG
jgi:4-amino-4-deoxy-L-arabinose transferase-like glycosyltransferase